MIQLLLWFFIEKLRVRTVLLEIGTILEILETIYLKLVHNILSIAKHFCHIIHPTVLLPGPDILLLVSNWSRNFYQCIENHKN
jgi:hypothetical protein